MTDTKKSGLLSFLPPPKAVSHNFQKPATASGQEPSTTKTVPSGGGPSTVKTVPPANSSLLVPRTVKQNLNLTVNKEKETPTEALEKPESASYKRSKQVKPASTEPVNFLIGISNYGSDSDDSDDDLDQVREEPVDDEPEAQSEHETNDEQGQVAYEQESSDQHEPPTAPRTSYELENIIKMHGGNKRKHEAIVDIVDVNVNEIIKTNKEDLLKNMTKEEIRPARQYTPGGRKKHQITYLAMMAKERDQELKNAWSDSKHNRRMGRQKYGF
jgi:hypothetical protein